jgi:dihydrofolate synthase / folylpolyglutamate synthase
LSLTYAELVAELFPRLTGGIRWGLERTRRMLAHVGDPHLSYRVVHIGGTNGKGSVAAHIESVLLSQGRRAGLYTSPHLCSFRERIRTGGRSIDEAALLAAAQRLWPVIREEAPSFFEATTAVAFLALAEAGVEDAVIEVGLGGRLDATNVVTPAVTVLTNVSLDHVQLLGPTLRDVAREKAGIIKAGVPLITGEAPGVALDEFTSRAAALRAPLRHVAADGLEGVATATDGTRFKLRDAPWAGIALHTPLPGAHQALNAALAAYALAELAEPPTPEVLKDGVRATRWPGRLQVEEAWGTTWIFDVAHNVAGVDALVAALRELQPQRPLVAVVGVLGDKDWPGMLGPIDALADAVMVTAPPTAPAERRWDPALVVRAVPLRHATAVPDFATALAAARGRARDGGGSVLITGSFHTVGDALAALRLCADGSDVDIEPPSFVQGDLPGRRKSL